MNNLASKQIHPNISWAVLILGLLLSYAGFQVATELENRTIHVKQQEFTYLAIDALNKELALSQSIVLSIRSLFLASSNVTRSEFKLFTEAELKAHSSIQALEWAPYVSDELRESFRQVAIADGLLDYDIREADPQGELIPAKQRSVYLPIYYVEPLQVNTAVLGFDMAVSADILAIMDRARLSHDVQASGSISLVPYNEQQRGFLIVQPTFASAAEDHGKLQAAFNGYAIGVFRINDLFEYSIQPIKSLLDQLVIEVTDITDPQKMELLHRFKGASHNKPLASDTWRETKDIHFANRNWRLTSTATPEFIQQHSAITQWLILLIGCTLTLLITGYLRLLIRREAEVKSIVSQRNQELLSSEKMSLAIVENAVDPVITIDEQGAINLFSPAAVKLFGYSPAEVIGQNVKMLMPQPYQSEHDGYLKHHRQTGENRIIGIGREVTGLRKDGSIFPMNLSVGKANVNGATIYVGTVTDLTLLKEKEKELQHFSSRLDIATRTGKIGIWEYDIIEGTLSWDDRMFELYGVTRYTFSGAYEAWHNSLHPDDLERAEAENKEAIQGGKKFDTEFRIIWPDGQIRHIHAAAMVSFDGKDQVQSMIGINLDITDSKRSEENLRLAKHAAEEANRQKSAFLNVMSHELRTPLTVILGYLPLLKNKEQPLPPDVIVQIADDMDISGHHLLEMINDLLDISKIEAGQMNLSIKEIQSKPLIEEMFRKFANQAQQKGIELVSSSEDFSFQVDELRLRQILINLLGNALKFTPQGSIKITAKLDKKFATFSIIDTGIGIPDSELPFVFDNFRQVDDSSTRNTGGSGLGLAITKRLVELHNGTIQAASEYGSGTTFTFTIKQ